MKSQLHHGSAHSAADSKPSVRRERSPVQVAPRDAPRLSRGAALQSAAETYASTKLNGLGNRVLQRAYKGDREPSSDTNTAIWEKIKAHWRRSSRGREIRDLDAKRAVFEDLIRSDFDYTSWDEIRATIDAIIATRPDAGAEEEKTSDGEEMSGEEEDGSSYEEGDDEYYDYDSDSDYDSLEAELDAKEEAKAARHRLIASVRERVASTPIQATIIWTGGNLIKRGLEFARIIPPELWSDQAKISQFILDSTDERLDRFRYPEPARISFASGIQQQHDQEAEFKETIRRAQTQLVAIGASVRVWAPRDVFLTPVDIPGDWHWERYSTLSGIGITPLSDGHRRIVMTMGHGSEDGRTLFPTEIAGETLKSFSGLNGILRLPVSRSVLYVPMQCYPSVAVDRSKDFGVHSASVKSDETIGNTKLLEWLDMGFLNEIKTWLPEARASGGASAGSSGSASRSAPAVVEEDSEEAAVDEAETEGIEGDEATTASESAVSSEDATSQLKAKPAASPQKPVMQLIQIDDLAKLEPVGLNVASWAEFDERLSKVTTRHGLAMRMALLSGSGLSLAEYHAWGLMKARSEELFGSRGRHRAAGSGTRTRSSAGSGERMVVLKAGPHFTKVRSASDLLVWLISNPLLSRIGLKSWAEPALLQSVLERLEALCGVLNASEVWEVVSAQLGADGDEADDDLSSESDEWGESTQSTEVSESEESSESAESSEESSETEPWPEGVWSKTNALASELDIGGPSRGDFTVPVAAEFRRKIDADRRGIRIDELQASLSGYTLVGIHATTAENIGGLVKFGPQAAKTGSGHQLGKGRGFYVIPVGAVSLAKAIKSAKGWGSHIVAVYLKGGVSTAPGGSMPVEEHVLEDGQIGVCYQYGAHEVVIPEYMYGRLRIVRDPDDITMASPGYHSKPSAKQPLEYLTDPLGR